MKRHFYLLGVSLCSLLFSYKTQAQGCVAIRSTGNACMLAHPDSTDHNKWVFATNARYFKSFRHYSGIEENKDRLKQHTEVINHTVSLDFNLTRILNDRWSLMIDLPVISNARSSLYEHGLINGNIQVGLGIKLPTGDYDYQDYWYNVGVNGAKELRTVDQSIQLGDGGTGFTFEANTYYNISHNFGVYANLYYLSNPREQNGVRTYRETLTPRLANEAIMSVPDQYMVRGGFSYALNNIAHGLSVAAGVRLEGVPVHDIVGGSGDFRRPGYVWSVEPGINYSTNKYSIFVSVPVAFVRNRTQSVTDKDNTVKTGTYTRGDAAFADYSVNAGIAFKF
jgi:hypothetical protein